jgi:hypothetical protein
MKLLFPFALVASACAQVELSTSENDAQFARTVRQTVDAFALSRQVDTLVAALSSQTVELSSARSEMAAMQSGDSPLALGIRAIADEMTARTQGLVQSTATNAANLASITGTVQTRLAAVDAAIATAAASFEAQGAALNQSIGTTLSSLSSELDTRMSNALSTVTAQNTVMNASVTRSLLNVKKLKVNLWSGGCSSRGGSGWQEFCLNVQHYNTAAPYFRKQTNTRFQTLIAGIYTIRFSAAGESCNWAHTLVYIDGRHWEHTLSWQGTGHWQQTDAMVTHPVNANKQMWGKKHSGCWQAWHRTDNSRHTFIYVKYDGAQT